MPLQNAIGNHRIAATRVYIVLLDDTKQVAVSRFEDNSRERSLYYQANRNNRIYVITTILSRILSQDCGINNVVIKNCAVLYDHHGNSQLDLGILEDLYTLHLDLHLGYAKQVYLKFVLEQGTVVIYGSDLSQERGAKGRRVRALIKIAYEEIEKRITSSETTIITIKCESVDNFTLL